MTLLPELSLYLWLIAILVITIGSFIQGVIGYGIALFSAPLLFLIYPGFVPAPLIILGGIMSLLVLRDNYQHVVRRDLYFTLSGSFIGVFTAWLVAGLLSAAAWDIIFGGLILLAVAVSVVSYLRRNSRVHSDGPGNVTIFAGAYGTGLMGTITGVGGPPIGLAYQQATPGRIRGSLSATFIPASIVSLIALWHIGRFSLADLVVSALLAPAMFAGFYLSQRFGGRLPASWFTRFLLSISAIAGFYAVLRGFL
ncbi:sulfite exporter TauE/SafE family protein [Aliidiomarina minuta]|uniref:Probable membrane transporter protein n=1 Tax=Aliidiomarina minuta TaxID=880057 RepID=A0A432W7P7_9GAMM|nr:sulfite exporter TauE/SafE family protein [Aliidiomarina minuta]RUO26062.1 sulfite exporter TauE/SafE family protein [Aliidiomarina minuta]